MKYKDIINVDEKKAKKQDQELRVAKAELQLKNDLLSAQVHVQSMEEAYANQVGAAVFNPQAILDAKRDLNAANEDYADLVGLHEELF